MEHFAPAHLPHDGARTRRLPGLWRRRLCGRAPGTLGAVFSGATGISSAAAERFLQHMRPFHDEVHRLSFDDFAAVASHVNRSSLGTYGVPYQAWLGGGGVPLRLVYEACVALTEGTIPPSDFNSALLAFIPKAGPLPGTDGYEGKAWQFRPLTLSNSCQKLIAKAFGAALENIAMQVVHPAQSGSVRGRKMLLNVLEAQLALEESTWHGATRTGVF